MPNWGRTNAERFYANTAAWIDTNSWHGTTVTASTTDTYWANYQPQTVTGSAWFNPGYAQNNRTWMLWEQYRYRQPSFLSLSDGIAAAPAAPNPREVQLRERRREVHALRKRVADRRAEALLLEHLTPEQRDEYRRLERFTLILPSGRTYRLRRGIAGNIDRIEDGRIVERLCVHVPHGIPEDDNVLVQKLNLEVDEEEVRRTANIERMSRAA